MRKRLLTLALAVLAVLPTAWAYDFSATSPSGHTLYYEIISGTTNVGVVRPGTDSTYNNYVTGNVVIPATIVYNNTTYNVTELRSVNNYGSFESCSGLTSVTIPNSVTTIGEYAFAYCSGLTSVTIPNSVTSIGDWAFYKCIGLTSVTIPNSVNSIGEGAFYGCSGLTSVTIPNSVTTIGNNAFGFVKNIIYNGTATGTPWGALSVNGYIEGDFVYANNTKTTLLAYIGSDTNVTIPNSVTSIGSYAFAYCSGLISVTIPNSVTSIGNDAFYLVKNIIYNGTATGSPWGALSVNGYIEGDFVYANNTKTSLLAYIGTSTSVTIPNSVTSIGSSAFYNCSGLTSVTIPNSVTSIGNSAFAYCSGLTSVTIPNSVTTIGNNAFAYCSGLTSVTIPNSVDAIHDCTFLCCTGLTSVTIPNSVTYIGDIDTAYYITEHDGAFYGCTALTSITIPNSVTYIGDYTFYGCTGLTSVTLPDYIDYIGGYGNCYIGSYAFYGCSGLTSVTIPDYIGGYGNYYIGNYAFYGCTGLTSVTIPNSVTAIGYAAFQGCSGLTSVTIPNSVTNISGYAFQGCSGLTSVTISPNRFNTIGNYAFQGCTGLTSVTIGKRVSEIEEGAFYGCNNLYEVVSLRASPSNLGSSPNPQIFSDTVVIPILKVPCGRADAYRSSDRWSQYFVDIEEICDSITITVSSANESMGTVSGSGEYEFGTDTTITATPNDGYRFVSWNDGNTDNPRAIIVTEDATYIANFAANTYSITVISDNDSMGTVLGGGEYEVGSTATIAAIPNQGYRFVSWNDGNTDNPRTITVTEDATYIAIFEEGEEVIRYTITVLTANGSMGTVSGGGEYEVGTEITITAIPNEGYHFVTWNDGNTDNPRTITVTEGATYIATFEEGVGIESRDMLSELAFYPNPTSGIITFNRSDIMKVEVLDAMGRTVEVYENAYTIDISKLEKGYYAMRITTPEGVAVRKVVRK